MTSPPLHVDLWVWPIDGGADTARSYDAVLSFDEKARADRFLNPAHGHSFRIAHGRVRELLGAKLNMAPASLSFVAGAYGKPALASGQPQLSFNLTHSGNYAALAVAEACDIGVDIEEIRPVKEDIAERFFSSAEISELRALPEDMQNDAFFRCWTRKEAIVKALGSGLSMPLDRFTVDIMANDERGLVCSVDGQSEGRWRVAPFLPASGFHGAVAAQTDGRQIVIERHL